MPLHPGRLCKMMFLLHIIFLRYCLARGGLLVTGVQASMVISHTWIQLLDWLSVGYFLATGTVPCQIATGSRHESPEAGTVENAEQMYAEAGR